MHIEGPKCSYCWAEYRLKMDEGRLYLVCDCPDPGRRIDVSDSLKPADKDVKKK